MSFHKHFISHGVFDDTGRYAATADIKGNIALWELPEGRFLRSLAAPGTYVPNSGRFQRNFRHSSAAIGNRVSCLSFDAEGKMLAASSGGGDLFVWEIGGASVLQVAGAHRLPGEALFFGDEGGRLVSIGRDKRLVLWDLAQKSPIWEQEFSSPPRITACAEGRVFAVFDSERQEIGVFRFRDGHVLKRWPCSAPASTSLAFSHDGAFLAVFGPDTDTRIWRLDSAVNEVNGMEGLRLSRFVFGRSSPWFFVEFQSGKAAVYHLNKDRVVIKARMDLAAPIVDACFSENGSLTLADSRGVVSRWPLMPLNQLKFLASAFFEGE